jgi:hypothetical protein
LAQVPAAAVKNAQKSVLHLGADMTRFLRNSSGEIDGATQFIPVWVGVAGTMVANHSGLQWATIRNLLMAWVLRRPIAILLAGALYWFFRLLF